MYVHRSTVNQRCFKLPTCTQRTLLTALLCTAVKLKHLYFVRQCVMYGEVDIDNLLLLVHVMHCGSVLYMYSLMCVFFSV